MTEWTLTTNEKEVDDWLEKQPLLFCHAAIRITLAGHSKYQDFVFGNSAGLSRYREESHKHFSKYYSLVHWAHTPPGSTKLGKHLPRLPDLQHEAGISRNWHTIEPLDPTFPKPSNKQKEAETPQERELRQLEYRTLLVNSFPELTGKTLCSLGFSKMVGEKYTQIQDCFKPIDVPDSYGYAITFYYVEDSDTVDHKFPAKLIRNAIIHVCSQILDNLRRKRSALEIIDTGTRHYVSAYSAAINSLPDLQYITSKIGELAQKVSSSLYGITHNIWNSQFAAESGIYDLLRVRLTPADETESTNKIDRKKFPDDPHCQLKWLLLLYYGAKFEELSDKGHDDDTYQDILEKEKLALYLLNRWSTDETGPIKAIDYLRNNCLNVALQIHEKVTSDAYYLPAILTVGLKEAHAPYNYCLEEWRYVDSSVAVLACALTYITLIITEFCVENKSKNGPLCTLDCITPKNGGGVTYKFLTNEGFVYNKFEKILSDNTDDLTSGRLGVMRASLIEQKFSFNRHFRSNFSQIAEGDKVLEIELLPHKADTIVLT